MNIDPLSYSSSNLLLNCEMKYFHKKVAKTAPDSDSEQSTLAMDIGKVLHKCCEVTNHDLSGFKLGSMFEFMAEEEVPKQHGPLLWAMVRKYKDLHEKVGLTCKTPELKLQDPSFLGFIDAIMVEPEGWWIVDLKTAGTLNRFLTSRLHRDRQLNLYAYKARMLRIGFDAKFLGCRYRVVTKSKIKQKIGETFESVNERMYKSISAYDFEIPRVLLDPKAEGRDFKKLRARQESLWKKTRLPTKNLTYCDSYFRPCEYWSQCHGSNYSDESEILETSV